MGNGATSLGSDKPSSGVITLEPINFVIDPKLTGRPELPMEEDRTPSADLLKKLTAAIKSLGVDVASNLDAQGNLKPDQVEGAKKRVAEQLEAQKKKTGIPPEDKKAFAAVLPHLKNETEFPLLSEKDQAQILKDAGFKDTDEALKAFNKEYASPQKKVAHFVKLKAREAEAEKKPVWTAARLYDTAAALDPDNNDLRLEAARAKRVWAEAETDPESKKTLLQESVVHLHAVLKKDPDHLEALNQLKQTLTDVDTPEAAAELAGKDLSKLLGKKEGSAEVRKARAEILGVLGQDKEDQQKAFDAGLEKAEALAKKDPDGAKEILNGLEKDLGKIEKFAQSGSDKSKVLDWNRLRRFYKATGNTEKLAEVEKEIRAECEKLRGTLKLEKGASPNADQLETAQFLADFSAHRQSYEELTTDLQTWKQLVLAAPPEVLNNSSKLDQLLAIYKDMTYLKDEAVKIPRPLGQPVGEVEPGYENATHNSKGELILRYEAQSEEEKVRSEMGLIQGDINRLVEQMEREKTGVKEGGLPSESYQRMAAVSDLLVTLQYSQPKEENVAREFLSLKGLDTWVEKKGGADQFLSKAGEIQDPEQKRAALFHALHAYADLKDEGKMRETIEQIQKTLPFMPKGPEELAQRLQVEQVIQTAVKGVSPELEAKFKKSCEADVAVLQGMVDEGAWIKDGRSVALTPDEKFRAIKAISGNAFVDAENSLDENGFLKKEKVDDAKQTLHAKLEAFKKTKDYVGALDRVEDEGAKNWKPTFASTQKLWNYLNDQPEYILLSLEDRKAFLKGEGYEVFEGYNPRVGDVAKSVVNDISPFKVFDSQDFSRINIDAVRPSESVSARLAVFTDRQAARLEDKGLPEEAARTYKAALEKNPDDPQARLGYARNLIEWEKVSQKIHPDPKRLQAVREEAAQQVKAVLDKNPKNWEAKGLGLEITLDQKYENDPQGKLKFLRDEFDKSITLYEGLAAKDKTEGAACLNYLRTIAGRFHSNFENPGNLDELKDLARAYRLFKAIPHKSEEDRNIFQHYVELLDRNMNGLKSGTLKYEGVDPLTMARTVVEIDTKVRKMPDFEIADDLKGWQKALEETPREAISPEDRINQYGSMMKEWMRLRDRANSGDVTTHVDPQKVTDENIRPLADKIRDEMFNANNDPGTYDRMNDFFDRLIDKNDLALIDSLSANGLNTYIEKSNQLDQTFGKAKSLSGAQQRTALLGVIGQARGVRNEEVAQEAVKLYEKSLGEETPPDERLKATLDLNQALKGSKFAVAEEVEGKTTTLVQDTWNNLKTKNSADASTVRQLLLVADFMGKERFGEGPKIAAQAKEKVKMIRAALVQTLDGKAEADFRPQTDEQRQMFTEALKSAPSVTDPKDRVRVANLVVDIDRALFNDSLNEAGDDVEKKNALSTRMLADFKRWQTSVGSVEGYTPAEKSEQMNLLMVSAFSLEKLGTEPGAIFKDPAFSQGIKGQLDSLQKDMKDLSGTQARAAFDEKVPSGSLPDADRQALWESFEKDFSPLFDKAWEGRNKPGQENLALLQVRSFTTQESLGEIVQNWKEADQAVKNCQPPKSEEDLKSLQKATLIFGGLGMTDRAKEAMKPLVAMAHAPGIKISDQVPLLNGLAQLYQQAGLTDEANAALQEIIGISESHDPTPEIPDLKQIGVLAKAFQYLNKNDVEKAEDVLATLPDNPTAKAVLEGIRDGRKKCRDMQMIGMLRAYYDNYEAGKNEEDGIIIKTVTAGSWEHEFDEAGKKDLRINRDRLDQIEKWMQVDGYDFQRAVQMAFIDDPNAYHEFNICLERFSADLNIAVNNLPRTLTTRMKGPDQVSFAWLSDPTLSDADFGTATYRFAESLKNQGMYSAASQIAQMASENKFISARARDLLMQGIPDAQKKEAFTKALVMSTTGMSILEAKSWGDVAWEAVMFVGPMAAGNALGSLGKSMYAARAVGVASKVEGLLLRVGVGAEEAAVWGARASKFGAWAAKSGFEALGFTGFEMGAERLRTGKLIYADDFMKKWTGMLVTFGLCHVTGSLASTEKKVVVEGIEVSVQRSPITRWLAGVGSFLAADMINESVGLKEKTNEHWTLRVVNAVKGDLSMRIAGEVVNKSTGGYFHQVEMRAEERMNENQYLRVADHMGLETSRDAKGELNENTARVIQETMALAEAKGIDPRNVEEVIKFQNELMENLPREAIDRAVQALDPTGENASTLRAALFSYVISETGGEAAPEAEIKASGKVEGTKAPQEKSAVSARELLDEIPAKMQSLADLKIPTALKATVMEQALVRKMGEVEVKALAEQMGEIHEAYTALVDRLGYKAAHLLIRQAIRGVNKIENLSDHLEALTGQLERTEKSLKQGLKGKEALNETELREAMEKLLSAALEISQAADDPKILEKALEALTQDFIEERKNEQKVKRALEEASQKAKARAQRVQPQEGSREDRGSREEKEGQEDLGLEGVGAKKGYRLPTLSPPPFLEVKDTKGMADYRANVESFDRGSTVQVAPGKNGRPEIRITRLVHAQEHVRTEWKNPNEIKNIEFREISYREDLRPADENAVRTYLWWGRSLVEANRDQVSKPSAAEIRNLNREFDKGTSVHATLGKDGRVRLEKVNEKGEIDSKPADMAVFKAYIDYVEERSGAEEVTIDELTRPLADALTADPLTREEDTHQRLTTDDFLTEESITLEKGPTPLENPFAMAAKGAGGLAHQKPEARAPRDETTRGTRVVEKKQGPSSQAQSVDGDPKKVWADVSDGVRNELEEKVREEAGKSITQNEADRVIQFMDQGPDSFNLVHEALSRGQLADLARDPAAFGRQVEVDFEVTEALGQVSDVYSFIDQSRRKHGLGDPTSPVEILKAEMSPPPAPSGKQAGIDFTVRSAEDGKVLLDHIASHAENIGLQSMPLEVVEKGGDFLRLKTPEGGEFTVRVKVDESAVAPVEREGKPQFMGLEVTPQFEEGLRVFISKEHADPFVDFSMEGARVALKERNYGRAERKEPVEGFAKDEVDKGFDHIVDRHSPESTKRGEKTAGIYAENVDIELMGRETVKSWDRASLSYDEQGRTIFIFQKDFTKKVGTTTKGAETKTNQVILSAEGKIISSFPVEVGTKGWVGKNELNGKGNHFSELFLQKNASADVENRHGPFLPGHPDALKTNLYLADVPYGVINQRTRASFKEERPSTNAHMPGTHQEEVTILKKGKPVKVMATVAEMRFEQPIGVREEVGPDGKTVRVPLYCNRTYFIEGNILGGYPIREFGEKPVSEKVWNPAVRPASAADAPPVQEKRAVAAFKGPRSGEGLDLTQLDVSAKGTLAEVKVNSIPPKISLQGKEWKAKEEFHVTLLGFNKTKEIAAKLKQEKNLSNKNIEAILKEANEYAAQGLNLEISLGKEYRMVEHEGNRSIIVRCDVKGSETYYKRFREFLKEKHNIDVSIETPPFHVTLFTGENGKAIGIPTEKDLLERSRPLSPEETAELEGALKPSRAPGKVPAPSELPSFDAKRFETQESRKAFAKAVVEADESGLGSVDPAHVKAAKDYLSHGDTPPANADLSFLTAQNDYSYRLGSGKWGVLAFRPQEKADSDRRAWTVESTSGDGITLKNEKGETATVKGLGRNPMAHPFVKGDKVELFPRLAGGSPGPKDLGGAPSLPPTHVVKPKMTDTSVDLSGEGAPSPKEPTIDRQGTQWLVRQQNGNYHGEILIYREGQLVGRLAKDQDGKSFPLKHGDQVVAGSNSFLFSNPYERAPVELPAQQPAPVIPLKPASAEKPAAALKKTEKGWELRPPKDVTVWDGKTGLEKPAKDGIILLENGDIVQRDGAAPVRMEFKDGRFQPKVEAPLAAAALRGPEVKVDVDLFQPLPSQVIGRSVIEEIKKEIVRDPSLNKKGQVRPEDVHEIICDQKDLNQKMDEVATQMIETKAVTPPKDLYFITNERRKNGVQVIGLYRYEIPETGDPQTFHANSLFTFSYQIVEGPKGEPLFKIGWIKAGDVEKAERSLQVAREKVQYWKEDPEVQERPDREERLKKAELNVVKAEAHLKAQEDFRKKVSNEMMGEVVQFVAKFPGATVQTRGDNLVTALWAGSKIPQARFIEVTDPNKYEVSRKLDPQFIDALQKIHVLTGEQAAELHKMLDDPVAPGWEMMQNINIHNQFIRFVRENYSKNPAGARNEVEFVFKPLLKSGEMRKLIEENREGHNRGDLWIEGQLPKKVESGPGKPPVAGEMPVAALKGPQSGEALEMGSPIRANVMKDGSLETLPDLKNPFGSLTQPGQEIVLSLQEGGKLALGDTPGGEALFKLRRGPRGYYIQPLKAGEDLEMKQGEGQSRILGKGQTQMLSAGDLEINIGKYRFQLKVP